MPDILKVTTPLINSNQPVSPKQKVDPASAFEIQDPSKVVLPHHQAEAAKQNANTLDNGSAPTLLMSLLRDPGVTVAYLKNICLLEEIFKLLPANNQTLTQEIRQAFDGLLLQPADLAAEMVNQASEATSFQGGLFDFLRGLSAEFADSGPHQYAISNLLKALNNLSAQKELQKAIDNNLTYIKGLIPQRQPLALRINEFLEQLRRDDTPEAFLALKPQLLPLMQDIGSSIYVTDALRKVLSIMTYNLSRYNNNTAYLENSSYRLQQLLPPEQRSRFLAYLEEELAHRRETADGAGTSKVMDSLVRLITKQVRSNPESMSDAAKTEKMLTSLLSSPCNFTPLLHYILPVQNGGTRAFAELWINTKEEDPHGEGETGPHFMAVIDIENIGRFEIEFLVRGRSIDFALFCPEGKEEEYGAVLASFPMLLQQTSYRAGKMTIGPLAKERSLMEIFKSLPYKRVGVDVKI
ncbi:hypothetical protein [Acidaminobacterium chupaoyuni]